MFLGILSQFIYHEIRLMSMSLDHFLNDLPSTRDNGFGLESSASDVIGFTLSKEREAKERKILMGSTWNFFQLDIAYHVLGWTAFCGWSCCLYPQVILNYRRKSVVGLNFNFMVLNLTKQSFYLVYNASLYFSKAIQRQYFEKYGFDQIIPVAANDVAFSIHAVLLTMFILFQITIYARGGQTVSRITMATVFSALFTGAVCFFIALPSYSWLWLISDFNAIQVAITVVKFIPQAFMNFGRKSTDGFSIGYVLLDACGGLANYAQMVVQSVDQGSWVNLYGNIGKLMLSLIVLFFDLLFIFQHYVLYPTKHHQESKEPLITYLDNSVSVVVQ